MNNYVLFFYVVPLLAVVGLIVVGVLTKDIRWK